MIRAMVGEDIYFPGDPEILTPQLQHAFKDSAIRGDNVSVAIAPFGAYRHSLRYIVAAVKAMGPAKPDRIIILAPPDSRHDEYVLLPESDHFATPLGTLPVATDILHRLHNRYRAFVYDEIAHLQNHSIEVLLPALHYYFGNIPIVPLLVPPLTTAKLIPVTDAIASVQADGHTKVLVAANLSGFTTPGEAEANARKILRLLLTAPGTQLVENISTFESPPRSTWPLAVGHILAGAATRPHILDRGSFNTEYEGDVGTVVFASIVYTKDM